MKRLCAFLVCIHPVCMSNAIGCSRESNPSRRICDLRAVRLGHIVSVSDKGLFRDFCLLPVRASAYSIRFMSKIPL